MPSPAAPFQLLAISDRRQLPGADVAAWAEDLSAAGVGALLVREKDMDDLPLFRLLLRVRDAFPAPGKLLVSGRADLARAAEADGVHLPARGLPTAAVRRHWRDGPGDLVGRSTHDPQEIESEARSELPPRYVTLSPIYFTPSKATYGPPLGPDALRPAAAAGLPILALGGVDRGRFRELAAHGASGAAGIRLFLNGSADLAETVAEARRCFPPISADTPLSPPSHPSDET